MRVPDDADMDFVAGAFIVRDGKILFLEHDKYDIWLQPGGHVEEDETPDEAAVRETLEETGMEVTILDRFSPDTAFDGVAEDLPTPFNVNLHLVEDGHYHCDFQYVARVDGRKTGYEYSDENMAWLDREEIKSIEDMPENARSTALRVLDSLE